MYILINGAFGIGKSTVARRLRSILPGATIFDPEYVGFVLQRMPGRHVSDFQDIPSWRRLTVVGARCVGAVWSPVIIPMAFSNIAYLDEIRRGLANSGKPVLHFCLTAPITTIRERLAARGEPLSDHKWAWSHRRAEECCHAHKAPVFRDFIDTRERTPADIAADIAGRVRLAPP